MIKIDLGNNSSDPSGRATGIMSGVNTKAMVDAAVQKRKAPIIAQENLINFNDEKVSALTQFNILLSTFQSSLTSIRGLKFSEDGVDAFQSKLVNLSTTSSEPPANYVSISADSTAALNNFSISINQLALKEILQSNVFTSNNMSATNELGMHDNSNLFTPGTLQLGDASVIINEGDSLLNIASKINSLSSTSNVTAQIVSPRFGNYIIILQAINPGVANSITINDPDNVLNNVFSGPNKTLQSAQDSIFTYNNLINVQRSSNLVTDFIQGVSFNLLNSTFITLYSPQTASSTDPLTGQATSSTTYAPTQKSFSINVNISGDVASAVRSVQEFVDNYNALVKFVTMQQGKDAQGHYYESAKIQRDDLVSNVMTEIIQFATQLTSVHGVTSNNVGLSLVTTFANSATGEPAYNNLLSLNQGMLALSLNSKFDSVRKLFELDIQTSSSDIIAQSSGNNINHGNLNLNIDINRQSDNIIIANLNNSVINMSFTPLNSNDLTKGGIIAGAANSPLDGYKFYYSGTGVESIDIAISQGVADKLNNVLQSLLSVNPASGLTPIQEDVGSLLNDNVDKQLYIQEQSKNIDIYKERLENKYIRMEKNLAKSNAILSLLDAQSKAMNKG